MIYDVEEKTWKVLKIPHYNILLWRADNRWRAIFPHFFSMEIQMPPIGELLKKLSICTKKLIYLGPCSSKHRIDFLGKTFYTFPLKSLLKTKLKDFFCRLTWCSTASRNYDKNLLSGSISEKRHIYSTASISAHDGTQKNPH